MCIYINRGKEFVAVVNVFPGYGYHNPLMARLPDKFEWQNGFNPELKKGGLVWYTDGSKTNKDPGAGGLVGVSEEGIASALGSVPHYSRLQYTT
jgi:hypothetical protein